MNSEIHVFEKDDGWEVRIDGNESKHFNTLIEAETFAKNKQSKNNYSIVYHGKSIIVKRTSGPLINNLLNRLYKSSLMRSSDNFERYLDELKHIMDRNLELGELTDVEKGLTKLLNNRRLNQYRSIEIKDLLLEVTQKQLKTINEENFKKLQEINLVNENEKVVFFLGAGASIPDPSSIPGVNNLLSSLWEKAEKLGKPELDDLKNFCEQNEITNIEDLLTAAYIADFCVKELNVVKLLGNFIYPEETGVDQYELKEKQMVSSVRELLNTLFSLLCGTMIIGRPNKIHESILEFPIEKSIITTNYDICMDTAISDYTSDINYKIEDLSNSGVTLIKMHGSINWFYCKSCQNIKILTMEDMSQIRNGNQIYPINGMCPACNALTDLLLVPPTSFKYVDYPILIPLWNAAQNCLKEAKLIVFVGYSFSESDDYILKMITEALRSDPETNLIVFNQSKSTIDNLKKKISLHIENYEIDTRLISFMGDANELLPQALNIITP